MNQLQQESTQTYNEISQEKAQVHKLQSSIDQYTSSLKQISQAMTSNEAQLEQETAQLKDLQDQIDQNEKQLAADKAALISRIRVLYENGNVSYLEVLTQSTSFDDLLSRFSDIESISQADRRLVDKISAVKATLAHQQQNLKTAYGKLKKKQDELNILKQTNQTLIHQKNAAMADVKSHLNKTEEKRSLLESQIQLTQSQINEIEQETQQAEQLMQNTSYVQQTQQHMTSVSASGLVSYAERFMGTPYVWGGTQPGGFDCSGYVQYVYSHFGVYLNRTSEMQFAEGVSVSRGDLQPGDLVFFSTYAPGASHVGIYIGNGLMVDAEDRGVTIDGVFNSYWGPKYIGARRVFK